MDTLTNFATFPLFTLEHLHLDFFVCLTSLWLGLRHTNNLFLLLKRQKSKHQMLQETSTSELEVCCSEGNFPLKLPLAAQRTVQDSAASWCKVAECTKQTCTWKLKGPVCKIWLVLRFIHHSKSLAHCLQIHKYKRILAHTLSHIRLVQHKSFSCLSLAHTGP